MNAAREFTIPDQVELLSQGHHPFLIGLRHHSAAITRALVPLLDAIRPECILLEMPSDFADWIEHLADEQTIAPIAISAADPDGQLAFYPLANFSPELAAIRWARTHRVPILPFDLSAGARVIESKVERLQAAVRLWQQTVPHDGQSESKAQLPKRLSSNVSNVPSSRTLLQELLARSQSEDTGQLWERLVETPGMLAEPEAVRRAALLFGWAVRDSSFDIPLRDHLRESAMREAIRRAPQNSVAVIGAFHASALLPAEMEASREHDRYVLDLLGEDIQPVGVSLVDYSFEQLDERSGYPAGIRDPVWHDRMVTAQNSDEIESAMTQLIVDICRAMRARGHVAGTPEATEIARMMRDLARVRGLPVAGRGELIESIQSCLVQGELHGRAREVARAVGSVLIGTRVGQVTPKAPRCGLTVAIDGLLSSLKLPRNETKELRLDVLRDARDRARAVVLRQFCSANIPYARRIDTIEQGNRENLVEVWEVGFTQGTTAFIASVSRYGVTLPQVVEGMLQLRNMQVDSAEWKPKQLIDLFTTASECGLHELTRRTVEELGKTFLTTASFNELVDAAAHIGRIAAGHVPGLPRAGQEVFPPILTEFHCESLVDRLIVLIRTSLDRLSGLTGSNDATDVTGLCELCHWLRGHVDTTAALASDPEQMAVLHQGLPQLITWCQQSVDRGSDLMRGAAIALLCVLEERTAGDLGAWITGLVDDASDQASRMRLQRSLAGTVQVLMPKMQSEAEWLSGLSHCLRVMSDHAFLKRLPALRGAFHEFSPMDRKRVLDVQLALLSERGPELSLASLADSSHTDASETLAALRAADIEAMAVVRALMPDLDWNAMDVASPSATLIDQLSTEGATTEQLAITEANRWRMVMGVPPSPGSAAQPAARSLDHLYGGGRGEGADSHLSKRRAQAGGGTESPTPTAAQWAEELEALFGSEVCQEVLGASAASGNLSAISALDPESVLPSVQLLQQVLSLAGGTAESKSARLRQIAKRITEQLANKLALRLRPHLNGLSIARPTRRRNRRLNLRRTIRDNLASVVRRDDGRRTIIAKNLIFNSAARREMGWHLTFVVDVSGSMSASVVYSAMCAAIFSELPALSVRFLAFSTEVIDLSEHVVDPLTLLLEVQVGGGTHIGLGLRHARAGIKVPTRSMVVLVTDFEEGVSAAEMLAETRALIESGVKCIGLAALDDQGVASFHQGCAEMMAAAGMPVAAVSPEKLASWVGDQIRKMPT